MFHPLVDRHNWEVLLTTCIFNEFRLADGVWFHCHVSVSFLFVFNDMNCILHMPADHVLNLFCTSENRLSPQTMQLILME